MPSNDVQANFPNISSRFVDKEGGIDQAWLQLLIALWNRTGGGEGQSGASLAAQLEALEDRVGGLEDRGAILQLQVDIIQVALDTLTTEVADFPLPTPVPFEDLYARLDDLSANVGSAGPAPADLEQQLNSLAAEVQSARTAALLALYAPRSVRFAPHFLLGGM